MFMWSMSIEICKKRPPDATNLQNFPKDKILSELTTAGRQLTCELALVPHFPSEV